MIKPFKFLSDYKSPMLLAPFLKKWLVAHMLSYGNIGSNYRHRVYVPTYLRLGEWNNLDMIERIVYASGYNSAVGIVATARFEWTIDFNQTITQGITLTRTEYETLRDQIISERTL